MPRHWLILAMVCGTALEAGHSLCRASQPLILAAATAKPAVNGKQSLSLGISVKEFGARCDGVSDDSPAFQQAVDTQNVVFVPVDGCIGGYLLKETVHVPGNRTVFGSSGGRASIDLGRGALIMSDAMDMFIVAGNSVTLRSLHFEHSGNSGSIIKIEGSSYFTIYDSLLRASANDGKSPLIYISGSSSSIENNKLDNYRRASFSLELNKSNSGGINIESHITNNEFNGTGLGMLVHSSSRSERPEGIHVVNNSFVNKSKQLVVEQALSLQVSENVFDQAVDAAIQFDPGGSGVDGVLVTGNWISAEGSGGGRGIAVLGSVSNVESGLTNVIVSGNQIRFSETGVSLGPNASNCVIAQNVFSGISDYALNLSGSTKTSVIGNTFDHDQGNIKLYEGGHGPFLIQGNQFWAGGRFDFGTSGFDSNKIKSLNTGLP